MRYFYPLFKISENVEFINLSIAAFKVVFMLSKSKGHSYFSVLMNAMNSHKNIFHSKYKIRMSSGNFSVCPILFFHFFMTHE